MSQRNESRYAYAVPEGAMETVRSGGTLYSFDIETRKLASDVEAEMNLKPGEGFNHVDRMGFGCGVIEDVATGETFRFGPDQIEPFVGKLREAGAVVGWNSDGFDLTVLEGATGDDLTNLRAKSIDTQRLLISGASEAIEGFEGRRSISSSLDSVAKANGLEGKVSDPVTAVRSGDLSLLLDYCEADVRIQTTLFRLVLESGTLNVTSQGKDADGKTVETGTAEVEVSLPRRRLK